MPELPAPVARWLLLVHQLPPRPSNLRVHVWRRLQQVGAIALRNSIYVLPLGPEAREDFDWIKAEIVGRGGQVSILAAEAVDGDTDEELRQAFRDRHAAEYEALTRDAKTLRKTTTARQAPRRSAALRELARLRDRLHHLKVTDFFGARGAADAQAAIDAVEETFAPARRDESPPGPPLDPGTFHRRVWLTRPRPGIDRMACAWLIRTYIDARARFAFGSRPAKGQVPFDMPDVEFGHHGTDCSFETLLRRFAITDVTAARIGQLVHDLDLKDSRYGVAEAPAIGRLVEGLRERLTEDAALLEHGILMIDALSRSFRADGTAATTPRTGSRRRSARRRTGRGD